VFIDHFLRFEANPDIKMMVLLGEVSDMSSKLFIFKIFLEEKFCFLY